MFCVWRGVCAAHCVHTVGLHADTQKSPGLQLETDPAQRPLSSLFLHTKSIYESVYLIVTL